MTGSRVVLISAAASALLATPALSAASLDPTFGDAGVLRTPVPGLASDESSGSSPIALADGGLALVRIGRVNMECAMSVGLSRLTPAGAAVPEYGRGVGDRALPDARTLGCLNRHNVDGLPWSAGFAVAPDGGVVAAGHGGHPISAPPPPDMIWRLGTDGVTVVASAPMPVLTRPLRVLSDGRVLALRDGALVRLTDRLADDTTFGAGGSVALPSWLTTSPPEDPRLWAPLGDGMVAARMVKRRLMVWSVSGDGVVRVRAMALPFAAADRSVRIAGLFSTPRQQVVVAAYHTGPGAKRTLRFLSIAPGARVATAAGAITSVEAFAVRANGGPVLVTRAPATTTSSARTLVVTALTPKGESDRRFGTIRIPINADTVRWTTLIRDVQGRLVLASAYTRSKSGGESLIARIRP